MIQAAGLARDAAESLAESATSDRQAARYLLAVDRISAALESPHPTRSRILMASPAITEIAGRACTLIEMIQSEPGDDAARIRLTKLLLRALIWRPESFPYPED